MSRKEELEMVAKAQADGSKKFIKMLGNKELPISMFDGIPVPASFTDAELLMRFPDYNQYSKWSEYNKERYKANRKRRELQNVTNAMDDVKNAKTPAEKAAAERRLEEVILGKGGKKGAESWTKKLFGISETEMPDALKVPLISCCVRGKGKERMAANETLAAFVARVGSYDIVLDRAGVLRLLKDKAAANWDYTVTEDNMLVMSKKSEVPAVVENQEEKSA